jgi:hypothetical protein
VASQSDTASFSGSTGTFDAALKDYYEGMIREILNRQARLHAYLQPGGKTVSGRSVVFPVNVQGSPAAVARRAGGALPPAKPQVLVQSSIPPQEWWVRIQINADLIQQARDDRGAFERPVAFEIKRSTEDLIEKMNRSGFGDGTGCIAEVDSLSSQVITLKDLSDAQGTAFNANQGNRYIKIGDVLDVSVQATAVVRQSQLTVTAKNVANNTVTVTGTTTGIVSGDQVYLANPDNDGTLLKNFDPMGIGGVIDDGSYVNTLQGINRTTYPIWAANATNPNGATFASPGALTLDLFQQCVDMAALGGPGFPGVALCDHASRREYLKLVVTDRRYQEKFKYDPGIRESHLKEWPWETTLDFDGFPLALDKHCPWRTFFFLDPRAVRKWIWQEFTWLKSGRGAGDTLYLLPGIAGTYEGQGFNMYNYGTDEAGPAGSTVLRNVSVPLSNGSPQGRVDKE